MAPQRFRLQYGARSLRIPIALGFVVFLHIGLFVHVHWTRWEQVIAPLNQPAGHQGEGLIIRGNGLGYYAWLRSLLIDKDWDFDNEFDAHAVADDWLPSPTYRTPLGGRANQWSVGPACVWAVTIVPLHFLLKILGDSSPWPADGYSLPYQLAVGATTLAMSIAGLFFLYGICRHYARPSLAALAAIVLTLGSTLIYYNTVEVSMAHGLGAVALSALIWYWLKTYGSLRFSRWFVVGLLVGACCLIRWQLATFAVLPVGEALFTLRMHKEPRTGWQSVLQRGTLLFISALSAFLAFLPQMIAWRCLYGHWLVEPVQGVAHHWLTPSFWEVLLSQDRSLFFWTPICAVACLGFFRFGRASSPPRTSISDQKKPSLDPGSVITDSPANQAMADREGGLRSGMEPAALVFAAFGLQAYFLASLWGQGPYLDQVGNFAGVFLSKAYGMRHLTESVVALAPGLAILLKGASPRGLKLWCSLGFVLVLWNLSLVYQYTLGILPLDTGIPFLPLLRSTFHFVQADPLLVLLIAEAVLLCLIILWGTDVGDGALSQESHITDRCYTSLFAAALPWATLIFFLLGLLASALAPSAASAS